MWDWRGHATGRALRPIGSRVEVEEFFERVRAGYLTIARREPHRLRVIDAAETLPVGDRQITGILQCLVEGR